MDKRFPQYNASDMHRDHQVTMIKCKVKQYLAHGTLFQSVDQCSQLEQKSVLIVLHNTYVYKIILDVILSGQARQIILMSFYKVRSTCVCTWALYCLCQHVQFRIQQLQFLSVVLLLRMATGMGEVSGFGCHQYSQGLMCLQASVGLLIKQEVACLQLTQSFHYCLQ